MVEDKTEQKIAVVMELPTQPYNEVKLEDGSSVKLVSLVDALTEMYNDIKEIKKAISNA